MRETPKEDVSASLYGICRLVAGHSDWDSVKHLPQDQRLQALVSRATESLNALVANIAYEDPKQQAQVVRKLKAYSQLLILEKFIFSEVDWD